MNTGKDSRSKEESALKADVTGNDVSNSEDEIYTLMEKVMRKVFIQHDLTGYTCYRCMERGHLGRHCPKVAEGEEVANQAPSVTPNVRCLMGLPNPEEEFLDLLARTMRKVHVKRDLEGYTCYLCKEKGHLARYCPKKEEEETVAEPAKPRVLVAAWCDETSDDEGRIDNVPNRLCLMGLPNLKEVDETKDEMKNNEPWFIDSGCSELMTRNIKNFISLQSHGGEITLSDNGKGKVSEKLFLAKSNYLDQKKCPLLENHICEVTGRNQEYYDVQDNGHEYYHPEYGPHPELEYYLEHYPQPGKAKLPWVRKR